MTKDTTCEFIIIKGAEEFEIIKWKTGYKNKLFFKVDFNEHAQLKRWCEENCSDIVIYWDSDHWENDDELYFFNEADAAACKLRWS